MKDFRKLNVWQKSHALTLAVYRATTGFPRCELYGMTSQMRRATMSIPANISEGCGRGTDADFARFLQMAMGSACELEYFLLLALELEFLKTAEHKRLEASLVEVKRMLASLIGKVRSG